jgi:hypothetical protein
VYYCYCYLKNPRSTAACKRAEQEVERERESLNLFVHTRGVDPVFSLVQKRYENLLKGEKIWGIGRWKLAQGWDRIDKK